MNKYFYHGIESYYGCLGETIEIVYKILQEGLKTRNQVRNYQDNDFNHVCLYRKNDDWDYNIPGNIYKSARAGWIDNSFVFIISPEIIAVKELEEKTDLVDEWRSINDIPPDKIIGIALPFESINDYLNETTDEEVIEDQKKLKKFLPLVADYAIKNNLFYTDSEIPNFTEELDKTLSNSLKK